MPTQATTKPRPSSRSTVTEAKDWLREHLDEGATCPVCTQFAKIYERGIHSTSARELISLYLAVGQEWSKVIDHAGKNSPDLVKCRYWALMEQQPGVREDGSNRVGIWRITDKGVKFIKGEITIPKKVRLFDGRALGFTEEHTNIRQCLGKRFRYDELMGTA